MKIFTSSSDGMYSAGRSFCGRGSAQRESRAVCLQHGRQQTVHVPYRFRGMCQCLVIDRLLYGFL